jgi:hypothetical protein
MPLGAVNERLAFALAEFAAGVSTFGDSPLDTIWDRVRFPTMWSATAYEIAQRDPAVTSPPHSCAEAALIGTFSDPRNRHPT